MSKKANNKGNNAITIIKHPKINLSKLSINESFKVSKYNKTENKDTNKPLILQFIKNNAISKAIEKKNEFNQTLKSNFVNDNSIFNHKRNFNYLESKSFHNRKYNKNVQPFSLFNNYILNDKYKNMTQNLNNLTKVKDQYLRLNSIYSPNKNYSEIVRDKRHIIEVFQEQTKTNFNNNYNLIYSSPNKHKRTYISICFDNIKNNNKKNIDGKNSIKKLAEKEIYRNKKPNIAKNANNFNKKNIIHITIPSTFDIDIPKSNKFKIQTLNIADDILKEYSDPFRIKKKKRIAQSAFYKDGSGKTINFFRNNLKKNNDIIYENEKV